MLLDKEKEMKRFNIPVIEIQRLDPEEIIEGKSVCFEKYACKECYCAAVQCGGTYLCTGLVCPTLSDYD